MLAEVGGLDLVLSHQVDNPLLWAFGEMIVKALLAGLKSSSEFEIAAVPVRVAEPTQSSETRVACVNTAEEHTGTKRTGETG